MTTKTLEIEKRKCVDSKFYNTKSCWGNIQYRDFTKSANTWTNSTDVVYKDYYFLLFFIFKLSVVTSTLEKIPSQKILSPEQLTQGATW